jgi:hypothetical protein
MEDNIKKDIIHIIDSGIDSLQKRDFSPLKVLSNETVHNASIFHDEASVTIAVIMYAMSKIAFRPRFNLNKGITCLINMKGALISSDAELYTLEQNKLLNYINSIDFRLSNFVEHVLVEAQIKKGWKLYDHGLSIETSADFLGISQWDLMNYLGNTRPLEINDRKTDIKSRLEFARRLFNSK